MNFLKSPILLNLLKSPILLAIIFVYAYYDIGVYEIEQGSFHKGILLAALSLGVSLVVVYLFKGGRGVVMIAQIGLVIGVAIFS